jgi:transposase
MDDVRLVRPDRDQRFFQPTHLDGLLPADHEARMIWEATGRLDLSRFRDTIRARGATAGRAAIDPRLLLALWLYAIKDGVGSGRAIERLCEAHDAYRWLCGGVSINYHTLNDFRVQHGAALDDLLTQTLTALVHHDVVKLERVAQDGTRIRASAGRSSFRKRGRLETLRAEMAERVATLKRELDAAPPEAAPPEAATPKRALQEAERRLSRVDQALQTMQSLESMKAAQKPKASKRRAPRASTTDPEARVMRMSDSGYRPAYNVQIAADAASRAIVGVDVTNCGSDANESASMREQIQRRTGRGVRDHLMDGGYVKLSAIRQAERAGVTVYAPVPQSKKSGIDPHAPRPGDGPAIVAWRARMATAEAKGIYRRRAATIETVNGDWKQHRGLRQFAVRGLSKARCVTLLFALMYNLTRFSEVFQT